MSGRYRTIVADPPWDYAETRGTHEYANAWTGQSLQIPYGAMTTDAIAALPIGSLAERESRVFLWTTNSHLPRAFTVLRSWGYAYSQTLVWHKTNPSPFSGSVALGSAEFLLVAVRGSVPVLEKARSSVITVGAAREHSRKPDVFLDLVESVSPGPYLELFARRQRLGWDTWGNEALEHVSLAGEAG